MKIKGYQPSKKCSTYIKTMVSRGSWNIGHKIPSLQHISKTLKISTITVRKVVRIFENYGIIENYGSLGFFLVSNRSLEDRKISKGMELLKTLKNYLKICELLKNGGTQIKFWIIKETGKNFLGYNIVSKEQLICSAREIEESLSNPISLKESLKIKNNVEFSEARRKYMRQRKILPLAKLIWKNKGKFNL